MEVRSVNWSAAGRIFAMGKVRSLLVQKNERNRGRDTEEDGGMFGWMEGCKDERRYGEWVLLTVPSS